MTKTSVDARGAPSTLSLSSRESSFSHQTGAHRRPYLSLSLFLHNPHTRSFHLSCEMARRPPPFLLLIPAPFVLSIYELPFHRPSIDFSSFRPTIYFGVGGTTTERTSRKKSQPALLTRIRIVDNVVHRRARLFRRLRY